MRNSPNPEHPGWLLSRACIRDTLLAKRDGVFRQKGICAALCRVNLEALRATQLSPYVCPWHANRILDMQTLKRAASDIVIVVRGGLVQEVRSTNPYTKVWLADYDTDHDDNEEEGRLNDTEERAAASDMHIVY